jgi:alkanesulfonate monooxygenase SsuD/methylene tetrahydromethanopterin reductase-like flavin-dependent oxidoreductase (luciferase family)
MRPAIGEQEMSGTVDKQTTPVLEQENRLKLGIFATNMRGGVTLADIEGKVEGTWEENVRYAQWADRIGLDAVIPIARWRGYGGEANLGDRSFETFTWATGLLAATKRIQVFATVHVPLIHPAMVAKMVATIDEISGGRIGVNVVAGWNPEELAMFGLTQREHDERYEVADEWAEVLEQLWTTAGESSYDGRFYKVPGGFSEPKPLQKPYPVIMNAGTSGAGREFAAKHSDLIFAGLTSLDTAANQISEIKQLAREQHGREIKVFARAHVVCRDSEEQARRDYDRIHKELADVEGARNVVRMNMPNSQSTDWESMSMQRTVESMVAGFFALPLVGTAEQVVQKMIELHEAGADGIALSWPDFDEGLMQMEQELLPLLVEAGLRSPSRGASVAAGATSVA